MDGEHSQREMIEGFLERGILDKEQAAELLLLADAVEEADATLPQDPHERNRVYDQLKAEGLEDHPLEIAMGRFFARFGQIMAGVMPETEVWRSKPQREIQRMVEEHDEREVRRALEDLPEGPERP